MTVLFENSFAALLARRIGFRVFRLRYLTFDQGRSYLAAKHEEFFKTGGGVSHADYRCRCARNRSERTWDYIEDDKLRPFLITPGGSRPQNWLIDGRVFNRGVNVDRGLPESIREMRDIEGRLKHMDELDIDASSSLSVFVSAPIDCQTGGRKAICRSYNQWLIDICNQGEGRLRWIAVIPVMDMASAVEEIRLAKANGACGIFSRGLIDDKRLSHPFFFPLYEAAEKADLPFCVHASTGNFELGAAIRRGERLRALQGSCAFGLSLHRP